MNRFIKYAAPIGILCALTACKTTEPASGSLLDCRERVVGTDTARWKWRAKAKAKTDWRNKVKATAPGYAKWKNSVSRQQSEVKSGSGRNKWRATASAVPCVKK